MERLLVALEHRDGHGLGPSIGWVGLIWVEFFGACRGLDGLGPINVRWVGSSDSLLLFLARVNLCTVTEE